MASPSDEIVIVPTPRDRDPGAFLVRQRRFNFVLAWLVPVAVILLWEVGVRTGWIDARFFPSPDMIAAEAWDLILSGELLHHTLVTLRRLVLGYPIGAVLGILVGLFIGRIRWARAAFGPTIFGLYTVPKLAIYPLLLLLFGIEDTPKAMLVGIGTFLLVAITAADAAASVPENLIDVGRAFRASRTRQFFDILLPAVLPGIFTSLRVSVGFAILLIIGTEFVNARDGIGFLIWNSWTIFQPEPMYVGMVVSAVLGIAAGGLINLLERVAMPWQPRTRKRKSARL
jgi:ABC-type nitrate/sulfonate/bicarbonate transport system permease component